MPVSQFHSRETELAQGDPKQPTWSIQLTSGDGGHHTRITGDEEENAAFGLGTSDLHHIALDRLEGE